MLVNHHCTPPLTLMCHNEKMLIMDFFPFLLTLKFLSSQYFVQLKNKGKNCSVKLSILLLAMVVLLCTANF